MSKPNGVILAIESAVAGGSLSLIRDGREVANWVGSTNISRAEDLLLNIDTLLRDNHIDRHEIGLVAVSAGPGSFTGIRIGIATALGLKAGLQVPMASQSALNAMVYSRERDRDLVAAVPSGRNAVCLQSFRRVGRQVYPIGAPDTLAESDFAELVHINDNKVYLVHRALSETLKQAANVLDFGTNIALAIGLICGDNIGVVAEPLFVSKNF